MAYVGIDGDKKQREMCLVPVAGEILPQRIPTPREECKHSHDPLYASGELSRLAKARPVP
jgi:hypothetical protein